MTAATLSDEAILASLKAPWSSRSIRVDNWGDREQRGKLQGGRCGRGAVSEGNFKEADAVEERIVEEMRLLGREAMQGWAENQVEATEREIRRQAQMHRQGKKNSAGIRNSARSRF